MKQSSPSSPGNIARTEWLTIEQTAEVAGLSRFTLYHWIKSGRLNSDRGLRKLGRRRYRVDFAAFRAAVEAGELG